jgi:hypothetical protein
MTKNTRSITAEEHQKKKTQEKMATMMATMK